MPKSKSSQAVLAAVTMFRSIRRSGDGIIDCGQLRDLRRGQSAAARKARRRRRQVLRVARVAAADADEVVALLLDHRERLLDRRPGGIAARCRNRARPLPHSPARPSAEQARDVGVAALGSEIARGLVVIAREAGVRALGQQQLHNAGRHGVRAGGEHQRRVAADVAHVDFGAAVEQEPHRLFIAGRGGVAERGLVALGPDARVSAAIEQQRARRLDCRRRRRGSARSRRRRS